jgi:hypothetical protein
MHYRAKTAGHRCPFRVSSIQYIFSHRISLAKTGHSLVICHTSQNPKAYYHVHKSPLLVPFWASRIQSQLTHTCTPSRTRNWVLSVTRSLQLVKIPCLLRSPPSSLLRLQVVITWRYPESAESTRLPRTVSSNPVSYCPSTSTLQWSRNSQPCNAIRYLAILSHTWPLSSATWMKSTISHQISKPILVRFYYYCSHFELVQFIHQC